MFGHFVLGYFRLGHWTFQVGTSDISGLDIRHHFWTPDISGMATFQVGGILGFTNNFGEINLIMSKS